jgi:hypothetical protein
MKITLHDAIQSLRPNIGFVMVGDNPSTIVWDIEGTTTPTAAQIKTAFDALTAQRAAEEAAKEAARISRREKLLALGLTEEELDA